MLPYVYISNDQYSGFTIHGDKKVCGELSRAYVYICLYIYIHVYVHVCLCFRNHGQSLRS